MSNCCTPESPVKRIDVTTLPPDFWRSNLGTEQPDYVNDYDEPITHNADVGLAVLDPQARLDINGASIWRPVELVDYPANVTLPAATTVDITSAIEIAQATPDVNVTLPAPTKSQQGRLVIVENTGTSMLMVNNNPVLPGTGIPFIWSGTTWIPYGASAVDFWRSGVGATLPDGVTDITDAIIHNGSVGVGLANPTLIAARLDVNGAQVLRPVSLGNFAANAAIGTAVATVDIASEIYIGQTTQNITLTLPNPTNVQAGRLLIIRNSGLSPFNIATATGNQKVWAGGTATLIWNGAGWNADKHAPYFAPITFGANLTLRPINHHNEILECTAGGNITVTVPNTLPVGFLCSFTQAGAGRIIFAGSGGMVVVNRWGADRSAGQWAKCSIEIRSATSAILAGDVV